jgi:hypothetical protein
MDILTLQLGEKTYSTGRFPAYLAREIMRIQAQQIEIAKTQDTLGQSQRRLAGITAAAPGTATDEIETIAKSISATAEAVLKVEQDIYDRLLWVICETYGNQFSADELDHTLSRKEIAEQIRMIAAATAGIFEKN